MAKFYGDTVRWWIGVVEDNKDPMKLGRVRVRIAGLHSPRIEDISTGQLPWAQVSTSTHSPGVSGMTGTVQLQPGARVFGWFFDGEDSQLPLVVGVLPTFEFPSNVQISKSQDPSLVNYSEPPSVGPGTGPLGTRNTPRPRPSMADGLSIDISQIGVEGGSNPEKAYNFFVSYGFTPEQAAGLVGNFQVESGATMSTTVKAAGSEQSFGIAQWNAGAGRLGQLKQFASDLGRDWTELDVQLQFVIWELENTEKRAMSMLLATNTATDAALAVRKYYERPSLPHDDRRIAFAKEALRRYNQ